ncbi:hypothetical protein V3W47_14430 [Deinococcus sp. YIM 134068]|uniref:hypothetical protein n=1 Tax=Deinococcus lichenicola TaxID=3118910 RepID=UPI002F9532C1
MRGAVLVWRAAAPRLWHHLPRLIVVNVLWLVASWPLLTLGAATLTAYAWLRRAVLEVEDERREGASVPEEPYSSLLPLLRRLWWPGSLWTGLNVALLVPLGGLALGAARSGTLAGTAAGILALYVAWFWLALQPFFLDALAEGMPLPRALAEAVQIVLAYPAYSHFSALPPLLLAGLAWWFSSLWATVGVTALLLYWACVATGDPAPRRSRPVRDVL